MTPINFFEVREVTNCDFIYELSDKSGILNRGGMRAMEGYATPGGNSLITRIANFFTKQPTKAEISAMCALKDLLAIGFSNGVLLVFDVDKMEIIHDNKHFTRNDKPIDKLKLF